MSPELSVGDVGKAAGGNAVPALSIAIRVGCSLQGRRSLAMSPELPVGGVGEVTVSAWTCPGISRWVGGRLSAAGQCAFSASTLAIFFRGGGR